MLLDLFQGLRGLRGSEPTRIWISRCIVIIVSLALLVIIFVILCMSVNDELPSIKTTFKTVDNLPVPDIRFNWNQNFTISCIVYDNYNIAQNAAECSKHINQTSPSSNGIYYRFFLPQGNLNFSNTKGSKIYIYLDTMGNTFNGSSMVMRAFDSEYSPYRGNFSLNGSNDTTTYYQFPQEISYMNIYQLSNPNISNLQPAYAWRFSRCIRKTMVKNALSYIGFQPNYIDRPYLGSSIQFIPFPGNSYSPIQVSVSPQSIKKFIITEETEQRSKTIGSVIGTIGGAWGGILSFYVLLFGSELIVPWGLVHIILKSKPKLGKSKKKSTKNWLCCCSMSSKHEDGEEDEEKAIQNWKEHRDFYNNYVITVPQKAKS